MVNKRAIRRDGYHYAMCILDSDLNRLPTLESAWFEGHSPPPLYFLEYIGHLKSRQHSPYKYSEWAYEVYYQMDHPALGQTPRAMFLQGLTQSGERNNRGIPYDDLFLKETMPTSRSEKGKIQKGKGIKLFGHYYQNDLFASRELIGQSVPIRYDPFDIGVLYAFVRNQWLPCQSQFYAQLSGRSERELAIITAELRKSAQGDPESRGLSAARLAAFLEKAEGHQALLLQRMKDQESHPILDVLVGGPRATSQASRPTPVKRPMGERSPVNLAEVPVYGEYV